MGLFKSIKDLGELQKMASEMPRPSMSETISTGSNGWRACAKPAS